MCDEFEDVGPDVGVRVRVRDVLPRGGECKKEGSCKLSSSLRTLLQKRACTFRTSSIVSRKACRLSVALPADSADGDASMFESSVRAGCATSAGAAVAGFAGVIVRAP